MPENKVLFIVRTGLYRFESSQRGHSEYSDPQRVIHKSRREVWDLEDYILRSSQPEVKKFAC